jgi:predicted RNA-binding Zn-ribbon protein involved in translation (DUF1610 family)
MPLTERSRTELEPVSSPASGEFFGGDMECPECGKEMPLKDETYSNINTERAKVGQKTGNIYQCDECWSEWIDDFLDHKIFPVKNKT